MGTQRGVVQARGGVFPSDPPEGLRGSLADAPQKFEQVDGGAEPAVEVDQAPEEQGPDRDHQAGQAIPQLRHRAAAAARPATQRNASEAREAAARTLESERDCERGGASDPPAGPRSPAPRTPPRGSPCCSARLGSVVTAPVYHPHGERSGRPRPAPERRAADPKRCEVRTG